MAALGVVPALALTGCGTGTIDPAQAEQLVRESVKGSTSGAKLEKVSCPSDVPLKTNSSFSCGLTVTLPDGSTHSGTVTLHLVDKNGAPDLQVHPSDYHLQ